MPTCVILTLQVKQGQVLQYRVALPPMRSRPASSRAFSSACKHRQVLRPVPPFAALLQRGHPPSLQFVMPRGVPLYPVLTTLFSLTMTHPTLLFMQLLLCAAKSASCMKYWSQLGRSRASFVRWSDRMASRREVMEDVEFSSLSCARWKRALSPVPGAKRCSSLRSTKSSSVGGVSRFAAQRSVNLFQRTLTGASTLMRRKNGRLKRASTTLSSDMSVVTQRSLHFNVTKSSRASTSWKTYCWSTALASTGGT